MKKLAFAGLGLLVVLALIAPFVTGTVTESSWRNMTEEFNKSSGGVARIETVEYNRDYLTSDILSKLILTVPEQEGPVEVYLRSSVSHGLLSARSETRLDPEFQAAWLEYFDQDAPLLVATAGIDGDVEGKLAVPAIAEELEQGGQLELRPLALDFTVTDGGDTVDLTLGWGGMTFARNGDALRVGEVKLAESLSHLTGELWVGDLTFSISEMSTETADGGNVNLEGFRVSGGTEATDNGRLNNEMNMVVDNITVGEERFGDFKMTFLADDFDVEATNAAVVAGNRLNEVAATGGNSSEQAVEQLKLFGEFMTAVRNLMSQGMNLGIPTMVLNTPQGPVQLEFSFVHPQLESAQREDMMSIFQYSNGGISLTVPSVLLEQMPPELQQQLAQLYQQGLIREVGDKLMLTIELDQMKLDVNGHAIPIPPVI